MFQGLGAEPVALVQIDDKLLKKILRLWYSYLKFQVTVLAQLSINGLALEALEVQLACNTCVLSSVSLAYKLQ